MGVNITLSSVSVELSGTSILKDVNLNLKPGCIIAVVGLSGSGKSTLLRAIAGLLETDTARVTGVVEIAGRRSEKAARNGNISMVFQRPFLFPWATAVENVQLHSRLHPTESGVCNAEAALELVGMTAHQDKLPHQLSGGMQQRVALAREFARRPEVLLLDEPFSSLDCITKEQLHNYLLEFWRTIQPTTILVTHDPSDAVYLADEVIVLRGGTCPIKSRLEINLDRPRDRGVMTSLPFLERVQWVIEQLRQAE